MKKTQLSPEALAALKKSNAAQADIMKRWDLAPSTVEKWIRANHPLLCHPDTVAILWSYWPATENRTFDTI